MSSLHNKRGLIVGIANRHSIAHGCAQAMREAGAELAITYLNDKAKPFVEPLAQALDAPLLLPCDVREPGQLEAVFDTIEREWGQLDFLLHSIAFAPGEALEGDFLDGLTREAFRISQEVSTYSFPALVKAARPMMQGRNGSVLTLSYLGAVRTMPNYNIMGLAKASLEASVRYLAVTLGPEGIRANAISAGPIKTLAASGIGSFGKLLAFNEHNAPLRRNVTIEEVGNAAAFMFSDLASGITGEIMYVDGGFNTTALGNALPLPQ